ncbi:MAG: ATP-binding protein [Methanoregulaceae archaeon]|jgi:hypothetical protein
MKTTLYDFYDEIPPDPGAMIESLRAFGYHLETSIADIIDNSISAEAHNIGIDFNWKGERSTISFIDDGIGMTEKVLTNAMRPGSKNPLEERDEKDLGRFGLGLKTASFSQCRKLTVGSKRKAGEIFVRCWDLDYINECGEWRLLKPDKENIAPIFLSLNEFKSGTIVLWEKIDRITKGTNSDNKKHEDHFLGQIDVVKDHLAMVFHRYLEKNTNLKIMINGRQVKPWDPFLTNHPSTQRLPMEHVIFNGKEITIQPFILPHRSKFDNDKLYEIAGGPGGWNERQGFYIYRNKRLIVQGDWLGLGFRKEQHTKLARILVDLPNSLDGEWRIDVKKSVARPPPLIRDKFKQIAKLTIEPAINIYRYRGKVAERSSAASFSFPWSTSVQHGMYHYSINRDHPIVANILQNSGENKNKIKTMLRLIEETVPVPLIILNSSNNPDKIQQPFEDAPSGELQMVLKEIWDSMINTGVSKKDAKKRLEQMEPFSDYPDFVKDFIQSQESEIRNE